MKFFPGQGGSSVSGTVVFLSRRRFQVFRSFVKVFRRGVKVIRSGVKRFRRSLKGIRREFSLIRSAVKVFGRVVQLCRRLPAPKKDVPPCINKGLLHLKASTEQINWRQEVFIAAAAWLVLSRRCGNDCRTGLVTVEAPFFLLTIGGTPAKPVDNAHQQSNLTA